MSHTLTDFLVNAWASTLVLPLASYMQIKLVCRNLNLIQLTILGNWKRKGDIKYICLQLQVQSSKMRLL